LTTTEASAEFSGATMGRAMPLRACRECGKEVSSLAPTCPHCGVPSPVPKPERYTGERFYNRVKGFIWFVVIAFAVLYFMSLRV
jgi:rRNA maturation protein Nop10